MLTTEQYKDLEDKAIMHYVEKHNRFLEQINGVDFDNAPPFLIAKAEMWYSQAQLYAGNIAAYYRKQQKLYEAKAEQAQADKYESVRLGGDPKLKSAVDAQYLSRMAKGLQLEAAAKCEGNYIRWNGILVSYGNAINSLKDMIKSIKREDQGGV